MAFSQRAFENDKLFNILTDNVQGVLPTLDYAGFRLEPLA